MKKLIALIACAAIALPLAAQRRVRTTNFASDFQTVPVMANVTGVGGVRFHSYVALLNPTAAAYPVEVTLYDANGTSHEATIQLAAHELKTFDNFLEEVFHLSGGGAVTFATANASRRFIVGTEVRTTPGGYSTMVPPLEFAASSSHAFAAGVTVSSTSRTNIGCFNESGSANAIRATVFDRAGLQAGVVTMNLAPHAWVQAPVTTVVSDGFIRFEPSAAASCYAVVVNNATSDGRYIAATEYQP